MTSYLETYRRSLEKPEEFWAEAAEAIDWEKRWDRVLDASRPPFYRWFAGGRLNTCWNALDRHVAAGHGERLALVWDSPVTDQIVRFTYRDLRDRTARFAGVLAGLGVKAGDRVLIYMPMVRDRDARLRPYRSHSFGRVRRVCLARAGDPHRRCKAGRDRVGLVRGRDQPDRPVQTAARRRDRGSPIEAEGLRHPAAANVPGRDDGRARP
jgi:hypothetical protein